MYRYVVNDERYRYDCIDLEIEIDVDSSVSLLS